MFEFLAPWGALGPLLCAIAGYALGVRFRDKKPKHGLAVE